MQDRRKREVEGIIKFLSTRTDINDPSLVAIAKISHLNISDIKKTVFTQYDNRLGEFTQFFDRHGFNDLATPKDFYNQPFDLTASQAQTIRIAAVSRRIELYYLEKIKEMTADQLPPIISTDDEATVKATLSLAKYEPTELNLNKGDLQLLDVATVKKIHSAILQRRDLLQKDVNERVEKYYLKIIDKTEAKFLPSVTSNDNEATVKAKLSLTGPVPEDLRAKVSEEELELLDDATVRKIQTHIIQRRNYFQIMDAIPNITDSKDLPLLYGLNFDAITAELPTYFPNIDSPPKPPISLAPISFSESSFISKEQAEEIQEAVIAHRNTLTLEKNFHSLKELIEKTSPTNALPPFPLTLETKEKVKAELTSGLENFNDRKLLKKYVEQIDEVFIHRYTFLTIQENIAKTSNLNLIGGTVPDLTAATDQEIRQELKAFDSNFMNQTLLTNAEIDTLKDLLISRQQFLQEVKNLETDNNVEKLKAIRDAQTPDDIYKAIPALNNLSVEDVKFLNEIARQRLSEITKLGISNLGNIRISMMHMHMYKFTDQILYNENVTGVLIPYLGTNGTPPNTIDLLTLRDEIAYSQNSNLAYNAILDTFGNPPGLDAALQQALPPIDNLKALRGEARYLSFLTELKRKDDSSLAVNFPTLKALLSQTILENILEPFWTNNNEFIINLDAIKIRQEIAESETTANVIHILSNAFSGDESLEEKFKEKISEEDANKLRGNARYLEFMEDQKDVLEGLPSFNKLFKNKEFEEFFESIAAHEKPPKEAILTIQKIFLDIKDVKSLEYSNEALYRAIITEGITLDDLKKEAAILPAQTIFSEFIHREDIEVMPAFVKFLKEPDIREKLIDQFAAAIATGHPFTLPNEHDISRLKKSLAAARDEDHAVKTLHRFFQDLIPKQTIEDHYNNSIQGEARYLVFMEEQDPTFAKYNGLEKILKDPGIKAALEAKWSNPDTLPPANLDSFLNLLTHNIPIPQASSQIFGVDIVASATGDIGDINKAMNDTYGVACYEHFIKLPLPHSPTLNDILKNDQVKKELISYWSQNRFDKPDWKQLLIDLSTITNPQEAIDRIISRITPNAATNLRLGIEETIPRAQLLPGTPNALTYVHFYDKNSPGYIFSNYYQKGPALTHNGYTYKTPEHFFQAQKFPQRSWQHQQIIEQPTANEAHKKGSELRLTPEEIKAWNEGGAFAAMEQTIRLRAKQDPVFAKALTDTGDAYIFEDTYQGPPWRRDKPDTTWGAGPDGKGENLLGLALMKVRNEINGTDQDLEALRTQAQAEREATHPLVRGPSFGSFATDVAHAPVPPSNLASAFYKAANRGDDNKIRGEAGYYKLKSEWIRCYPEAELTSLFKDNKPTITDALANNNPAISKKDCDKLFKDVLKATAPDKLTKALQAIGMPTNNPADILKILDNNRKRAVDKNIGKVLKDKDTLLEMREINKNFKKSSPTNIAPSDKYNRYLEAALHSVSKITAGQLLEEKLTKNELQKLDDNVNSIVITLTRYQKHLLEVLHDLNDNPTGAGESEEYQTTLSVMQNRNQELQNRIDLIEEYINKANTILAITTPLLVDYSAANKISYGTEKGLSTKTYQEALNMVGTMLDEKFAADDADLAIARDEPFLIPLFAAEKKNSYVAVPITVQVPGKPDVKAATIRHHDEAKKSVKLAFFFSPNFLNQVKNDSTQKVHFYDTTTIPSKTAMEWAFKNCDQLFDPARVVTGGVLRINLRRDKPEERMPKECIEALMIYCKYKYGLTVVPPLDMKLSITEKQMDSFEKIWKEQHPEDLGIKNKAKLEEKLNLPNQNSHRVFK